MSKQPKRPKRDLKRAKALRLKQAVETIRRRYGKNAIMKGYRDDGKQL